MHDEPVIAVLFALPDESGNFRCALERKEASGRGIELVVKGRVSGAAVVVAHTGVGPARAARRAAEILREHRPRLVISAGFAGGLQVSAATGLVVIDTRGAPCEAALRLPAGCIAGRIVSAGRVIEAAAEKCALGQSTGASAVDMETEAIAAAGESAGVPLLGVRVISDPVGADLPVPIEVWFDAVRQRPRVGALLWFLARHPAAIPPFARFVQGLAPARANLARALAEVIRQLIPRSRG